MTKTHFFLFATLSFLLSSCNIFVKEEDGIPVARVKNETLYLSDIQNVVPSNLSSEDSTVMVTNFINQWATEQLLIDQAQINLAENKQDDFDKLVEEYKIDLYINAYIEALVKQGIDTIVMPSEAKATYERNIESFKLNEELIKFRYINITENAIDLNDIQNRFRRFNKEDQMVLDSISVQFLSYSLNDSIWIKVNQVIDKIPVLNEGNKEQLLKKTNFIQLKDSLGLYLMQINDVLLRNETAPLEYVLPTVKQIVLNKRKLEFKKQLEKDITKDAIKNNTFEIYAQEE